MEHDLHREIDARLDAAQARVEQKLIEQKMDTNASIDAMRQEMMNMNLEMKIQFAKIDARFDSLQSDVNARIERGFASVIKWVIGLVGGGMIAFVTVITFVLNHAS